MGSEKDRMSDTGDVDEDIPSDFFDDFTREEFMDGLSVIDSWADEDGIGRRRETRRINLEALDGVKDLRELIGENNKEETTNREVTVNVKFDDKYKWRKQDSSQHGASSSTHMDDFIKPGSRRDPSKTNEAIKKDKDLKVKEYLAKHLESTDDLRPPGTELDDYYDEDKSKELKKTPKRVVEEQEERSQRQVSIKERNFKESLHLSPRRSPRRQSPRRMSPRRHSPRRKHSPRWSPRHSPARQFRPRFSPHKSFRKRFSPPPRRSPRRYTPPRSRAHSPRRRRSSRSPMRRPYNSRRSRSPRSRSPHHKDTFLYPNDPQVAPGYPLQTTPYQPEPGQLYTAPVQNEFPGSVSGYPYSQGLAYGTGFPAPYNYSLQPVAPCVLPESVPMQSINPVPAPPLNVVPPPPMVPAPAVPPVLEQKTPYDALAQLVAEGKISQEDYLKLAPNKGVVSSSYMDSKTMHGVMSRCAQAISKLQKLFLPNHLVMNNHIIGAEPKSIESKFCSPLKRQAVTEFNFTKTNGSTLAQQNKQLVESIITTIGLEKVVSRYKKKMPKDVKDAACQTTKPYCDVCEIRDSTKSHEVGTAVDPDYFTTTVHTQVVEHDLINSKSVFNPSGSIADGAPISIAHLTPAQLVSQLAARAKTLKQSPAPPPVPQNQFARRNPGYEYDGRGAGGGGGGQQQYHNYNNYRY